MTDDMDIGQAHEAKAAVEAGILDPRDIPNTGPNPGEGQASITFTERDPRCRGQCHSPDRPAWDSPAKPGKERGTGRRLVYCPCCNHELLREEDIRAKDTRLIMNFRPPNLNPQLEASSRRVVDVICRYDVVVLSDIKAL